MTDASYNPYYDDDGCYIKWEVCPPSIHYKLIPKIIHQLYLPCFLCLEKRKRIPPVRKPYCILQRYSMPVVILGQHLPNDTSVSAVYIPDEILYIQYGFVESRVDDFGASLPAWKELILPDTSLPVMSTQLPAISDVTWTQVSTHQIDHCFEKTITIEDIEYRRIDLLAWQSTWSKIRFYPKDRREVYKCDVYIEFLVADQEVFLK